MNSTSNTQTQWEQPPRRKLRMRRSPQVMALLVLLKRFRMGINLAALTIGASVIAGAIWGLEGGTVVALGALLFDFCYALIYFGWWATGYSNGGRAQWQALVREQRDKLDGLR